MQFQAYHSIISYTHRTLNLSQVKSNFITIIITQAPSFANLLTPLVRFWWMSFEVSKNSSVSGGLITLSLYCFSSCKENLNTGRILLTPCENMARIYFNELLNIKSSDLECFSSIKTSICAYIFFKSDLFSFRLTFKLIKWFNSIVLINTTPAVAVFRSIDWWLAIRVFTAINIGAISSVTPRIPI